MTAYKKTVTIAGILFILAAVTAIVGTYITKGSLNENQIMLGAFFEIILAFAVIGISVTLFPILKKIN
jgi:drug/metabolite transporter superfamily protein YnfA